MVNEDEKIHHDLKEIEQVNLILKKLLIVSKEKKAIDDQLNQNIMQNDELEQLENLTTKLNKKSLTLKDSEISPKLLSKINHKLRTPLTPIKSYTDMLLDGHYGKLSDQQLEKINQIRTNIDHLENAVQTLFTKNKYRNLNQNQQYQSHTIKELEQENILSKKLEEKESKKLSRSRQEIANLKRNVSDLTHRVSEQKQEKRFLDKSFKSEEKKRVNLSKKQHLTVVVSALAVAAIISSYSVYTTNQIGEQYRVPMYEPVKSSYIIQNLRGDTIDTWLSWRLVEGDALHVNIVNADRYEQEKIDAIKTAILDQDAIEVDNSLLHKGPKGTSSLMYVGWAGALSAVDQSDTEFVMPQEFNVLTSARGEGDITVELVDAIHPDGFSGWANSIADESQNQILKTRITIYDADSLTPSQIEIIVRHEFGHALGLAHSTAPEDLMHPTIETEFPYISECDIDAIISLYDGSQNSEVVCEI